MSHPTTLRSVTTAASRGRSTPPHSPRTLQKKRRHRRKNNLVAPPVSKSKEHVIYLYCTALLTVSQQLEQHLHLGQGVDAGEVCPPRATGIGSLPPGSRLRVRQQPIADSIMWPPAVSALCADILPVLYGRGGGGIPPGQTRKKETHSKRTLFCLVTNSATERGQKSTPRVRCSC